MDVPRGPTQTADGFSSRERLPSETHIISESSERAQIAASSKVSQIQIYVGFLVVGCAEEVAAEQSFNFRCMNLGGG